eukprot:gene5678-4818_t
MFGRPGGGTHDGMKEQGTAVELAASRIEPGHVAIAIQESEHEPPIDWTEVGIALNVAQAWPVPPSMRAPDISHYVGHADSTQIPTGSPTSQVQGGGIAALLRTADTKVGELPAYEQALLALGRHGVSAIAVAEAEPPMLRDKNLGEIQRGDRGKQHPEEYKAALCRLRQGVDDAIACQDPSREFAALAKNRSFKFDTLRAQHPQNRSRNRYPDILPHEPTRVKLQRTRTTLLSNASSLTGRADDYINANIATVQMPPSRVQ